MYEVGQIIYTILEDKYKVVPLKISEQVITKTLDEESITYKAIMPGKNSKKINLSKVSNLWENLDDVLEHLTNNANTAINKMLKETSDIEIKYFGQKITNDIDTCINDPNSDKLIKEDNKDTSIKIDLGNGQIGNLTTNLQELDQKKNEERTST